jgi:dephospho-CoA kinase
MKIFGLTGGIASGKSTVATMFKEHGITVLDADQLYHDLIRPTGGKPSSLARLIEHDFPGVVGPSGTIDRASLGKQIFHDPSARVRLNEITHPAVARAFLDAVDKERRAGAELILYDVPLLFESNKEDQFDGVIVVWVPQEIQLERLCKRNQLPVHEADARLKSQLSLDEKRLRADFVIDNSATPEATSAQVAEVMTALKALSHNG